MEFEEKKPCQEIKVDGFIEKGKQFDLEINLPEDNRDVIFGIIRDCYKEPVEDAVIKLIEVSHDCGKEERKPVEAPKKEEKKEQPKKEETKKEGKKNKKKKGNQQQKKEPAKPVDLLANKITGDDEGEWEEVGKKGTDKKKSYKDTQKKAKELYNSYLENF